MAPSKHTRPNGQLKLEQKVKIIALYTEDSTLNFRKFTEKVKIRKNFFNSSKNILWHITFSYFFISKERFWHVRFKCSKYCEVCRFEGQLCLNFCGRNDFLSYTEVKSREYGQFWLKLSLSRGKFSLSQSLWKTSKTRRFWCKPNVQFWLKLYASTV